MVAPRVRVIRLWKGPLKQARQIILHVGFVLFCFVVVHCFFSSLSCEAPKSVLNVDAYIFDI